MSTSLTGKLRADGHIRRQVCDRHRLLRPYDLEGHGHLLGPVVD